MSEVIFIIKKLLSNKNDISLNEFLNIADITEEGYAITIDGYILMFLSIKPQNFDLLSEQELENKMNYMSVEFSNEQYPYKILIMPKILDISDNIKEQETLKQMINNDKFIQIINNRIQFLLNLVTNKEIIENEFYLVIWEKETEKSKIELQKRANNWMNRLRNCELKSEILSKDDIIYLIKFFNFQAYKDEGNDYENHITKIKRKELDVKNK